jgi:hypothetical protein
MPNLMRSMLLLAACVVLPAVQAADVDEYKGQEPAVGEGLVIMRVLREQSDSSTNTISVSREYKKLMALIVSTDGRQKVVVNDISSVRAFLLPAGRWYLAEIRTPKDRSLPKISDKKQATVRSFEVVPASINYAGVYNVQFVLDAEGRQAVNVNLEFPPEVVQEASDAFPTVFQAWPLLYCPIGRKCKPPSEFQ